MKRLFAEDRRIVSCAGQFVREDSGIPVAAFGSLAYFSVFSFATFAAFGYARARLFLTLAVGARADDYLVKPSAFSELLARVRSLLQRAPAEHEDHLRGDILKRFCYREANFHGSASLNRLPSQRRTLRRNDQQPATHQNA